MGGQVQFKAFLKSGFNTFSSIYQIDNILTVFFVKCISCKGMGRAAPRCVERGKMITTGAGSAGISKM